MATDEPADDMAQEVERQLQLAIAAATLAARKAITARQTTLAQLHAQSETRAATMRAQLNRERTLASARIQAVFDQAWWENTSPAQVAEMWQQTVQWRQPDPGDGATIFDRAAQRIQQQSRDRWHVDVYDIATLAHADNIAEHDRTATGGPAAAISQQTSVDPSSALTEAYDTRARRERLQERMVAANVPADAIEARVLADTAQAYPITDAVQQAPSPQHRSRRAAVRTTVRQPERTR
jgi:hypothetical protein